MYYNIDNYIILYTTYHIIVYIFYKFFLTIKLYLIKIYLVLHYTKVRIILIKFYIFLVV